MKKILQLFSVIIIYCSMFLVQSFAQVTQQWVSRFTGPGPNSSDQGHDVAVDAGGNVYVTGHIVTSQFDADFITVKYNSNGDTLWTRRYDGPGAGGDDYGFAIITDASGNVYTTGYGTGGGAGGVYDVHTIKYNSNGDSLWVSNYRGPQTYSSYGYDITSDNSGNIFVTGSTSDGLTNGEFLTIKYDANGNELWAKRYGGPGVGIDYAYSIDTDNSGNSYVTGITVGDNSNQDFTTIKYSPSGDTQWVRRYNGSANDNDYSSWIVADGAGNSYIAGASFETGEQSSFTVIKYSTTGQELWIRKYNGQINSADGAYYITMDNDGNVIAVGNTFVSGDGDCLTIKYNPQGDTLWARRFNGTGFGGAILLGAITDNDDNVYVTGFTTSGGTSSDFITIKYSPTGALLWSQTYNGEGNGYDGTYSVALDLSGGVYVTGYSEGSGTSYDYATVKYSQTTGIQISNEIIPEDYELKQNYPNPFNPVTILEFSIPRSERASIKIYNSLGTEVATLMNQFLSAGNYKINFDASNFPSGIYFYKLESGEFEATSKMILVK